MIASLHYSTSNSDICPVLIRLLITVERKIPSCASLQAPGLAMTRRLPEMNPVFRRDIKLNHDDVNQRYGQTRIVNCAALQVMLLNTSNH